MYDQQRTAPQAGRVFLHQFRHGGGRGLTVFAVVAALLGLAIGAASLALLITYRSTAQAQVRELQAAVSAAQANSAGNTYSLNGQAAKLATIDAALATISQFNQVCSQDLSSASGVPTQFYFQCSPAKPGG